MRNPLTNRRLIAALPWLCGLVAAVIAGRNLIGGYGDLGIYLDVARELRLGGADLFAPRVDAGPWAYPHVAALPFAGLQLVLPDAGIRVVWCAGLGLATALLVIDLRSVLGRLGGLRWWQWSVFAVLFQRTIAQNLTHGQLSLWVAVAVLRGCRGLVEGRDAGAGVWLGVATALKLTPGLFCVVLPFVGRRRAALVMAATVAAATLLLPWPFLGTAEHVRHLTQFAHAVLGPLVGHGSHAVAEFAAGPNVRGALDHLLQPKPIDPAGHTVNVLDLTPAAVAAAKVAWTVALALLLGAWIRRARTLPDPERLAQQGAAVAMAIVWFSPVTRIYHLAGALLPFALFCRGPRPRPWLWLPTALLVLLGMTLRQRRLLGEAAWRSFEIGPLHLALVGIALWLCLAAGPRRTAAPGVGGTEP